MVTERVVVLCHLWESAAGGTFTVPKCEDETVKRGTKLTLYLKEVQQKYLEERKELLF